MIRGLSNVLAKDVTDINDCVFVLRNDARILASIPRLVGMTVYTGPKNGGKSFINMRLVNFLGDGPDYLAQQFKGNYLSCTQWVG